TESEVKVQVTSRAGAVRAPEEWRREHTAEAVRIDMVEKVRDLRRELNVVASSLGRAVPATATAAASTTAEASSTTAAQASSGAASTTRTTAPARAGASSPSTLTILTVGGSLVLTIGLRTVWQRARIVL